MFLWSLVSSPGHPHTRPSSPLPCPGRLAMIVTEYMENGSLDAFLRVRLSPRGRVHVHNHHSHRWGTLTYCSHTGVQFTPHPTGTSISCTWGRGGCEGNLKNWLSKCFPALNHEGPRVARAPTAPLHSKMSHATYTTIWEEVATFPASTSEYSLGGCQTWNLTFQEPM